MRGEAEMPKKILAISGSYRAGHTVEAVISEILAAAQAHGAEVESVFLRERHIEFCRNCRCCTQVGGDAPGPCPVHDDMAALIDRIEAADALVFGSPINFFSVTALFKRFQERLVVYAFWPWETAGPKRRRPEKAKQAVLVASSAMPGALARFTTGAMRALKLTARTVGARPVGRLHVGLAALHQSQPLPPKIRARARRLGARLAAG